MTEYVLTLSCPDRTGLVYAVTSWLFAHEGNILDSDQFGDPYGGRFFMRVHFSAGASQDVLSHSFADVAAAHRMAWEMHVCEHKPKVLVMVSTLQHCLVDLLSRTKLGELPIEVALIASNHREAYPIAAAEDIDFIHLPITPENRSEQERRLLQEIERRSIDFVVLARYMQVLSSEVCNTLAGRIINIHHSFLPSFKGARPYHQAHTRGVKLIGATAHYVTADLDEGPIIEQGIERVDHRMRPRELAAVGRDVERMVLAKAVRYHAEHRVLLNGDRTVVFH
jgi:formyltetrahydrofolate deformylase